MSSNPPPSTSPLSQPPSSKSALWSDAIDRCYKLRFNNHSTPRDYQHILNLLGCIRKNNHQLYECAMKFAEIILRFPNPKDDSNKNLDLADLLSNLDHTPWEKLLAKKLTDGAREERERAHYYLIPLCTYLGLLQHHPNGEGLVSIAIAHQDKGIVGQDSIVLGKETRFTNETNFSDPYLFINGEKRPLDIAFEPPPPSLSNPSAHNGTPRSRQNLQTLTTVNAAPQQQPPAAGLDWD